MSLTVEIRGSNTNNAATAETITLQVLGVRPHLLEEAQERSKVGGRYRKILRYRLAFDITFNDFVVVPSATWQDSRAYFELMRLLQFRYVWLYATGAELDRIQHPTLGLIANGNITLPKLVSVRDISEFSADFDNGVNKLDSLVLVDPEWYVFS